MRKNHKHKVGYLKPYRRVLRKKMTPAECRLWTELKGKKLAGRKFRKQHSIEHFIVDFYCASENLIMNWMVMAINLLHKETTTIVGINI